MTLTTGCLKKEYGTPTAGVTTARTSGFLNWREQIAYRTDEPSPDAPCRPFTEKLEGKFDELELIDLEIEFSSTILGDIEEWLGYESVMERGYKYVAKARLYSGRVLINKLLSFGSGIKVLAPAFIKEELLIECKRILRNADAD